MLYLVLLGFTEFRTTRFRAVSSFTEFDQFLLSFTGFYRVLPSFGLLDFVLYLVLPSFTRFYLDLLGFTGFYRDQ